MGELWAKSWWSCQIGKSRSHHHRAPSCSVLWFLKQRSLNHSLQGIWFVLAFKTAQINQMPCAVWSFRPSLMIYYVLYSWCSLKKIFVILVVFSWCFIKVVRYGNLNTWINLPRLYLPRFYQPRYNLGRFYLHRYYPSWFYPGSLSQKRILVITSILFWVSEPG